jgi:hypothetical protein
MYIFPLCRSQTRASHHNHKTICKFYLCCHQHSHNSCRQQQCHYIIGKIFVAFINLSPATCSIDALHKCSTLHGHLTFSCLLTIIVYLLSHFQLLSLVVSANNFRNPFSIFNLDKQHPYWLAKLQICWSHSSPFFESLRLSSCIPMWVWVYSRRHSFPIPCLVDSTLLFYGPMKRFRMPGCGFPRLKGRTNIYLYSFFWTVWWIWLLIV